MIIGWFLEKCESSAKVGGFGVKVGQKCGNCAVFGKFWKIKFGNILPSLSKLPKLIIPINRDDTIL